MPTITKLEKNLYKQLPKPQKIKYFFSSKIRSSVGKYKTNIKKQLQRLNKLEMYCGGMITEYKVVFRFTSSQSHDKNLIHGIHTKLKMRSMEHDNLEWICHEFYYDNKIDPPPRNIMFKNSLKNLFEYCKHRRSKIMEIIEYGDMDEYLFYYDKIINKLK
jgi:hypothetical protein